MEAEVLQVRPCICGGKIVQVQQSRRQKVWVHGLPAPVKLAEHRPVLVDIVMVKG